MSENLFNSSHKATNDKYREGYDAVFGKKDFAYEVDKAEIKFNPTIEHPLVAFAEKVLGWKVKCQD